MDIAGICLPDIITTPLYSFDDFSTTLYKESLILRLCKIV